MKKTAFAFPGAGVKPCGREAEFYSRHEEVIKRLLDGASKFAGVNLAEMLTAGSIDRLKDEKYQYFTYAFGAGVFEVLVKNNIVPDFTAGYSFGVYAALYGAGAVSFYDGLRMVEKAYALMKDASRSHHAGLGVIIGLTEKYVRDIIREDPADSLFLVITNSESCMVLSGPKKDLKDAMTKAKQRGAMMTEFLDVEVPYHHPAILKNAAAEFEVFLKKMNWKNPAHPLISSIDQSILTTIEQLIDFTAKNLSNPINWQKVVEALNASSVFRIIECGPGISLTQQGRFLPAGTSYINVKNIKRRLGI